MIEPDYKHVLFKDLRDYIRKDSYLGGFTSIEQEWIRKNIGAVSEQDAVRTSFNVSYEDLRKLIVNQQLNPGSVYIINDFQTIYSSNVKNDQGQYISYGKDIYPSKVYTLFTIAATNDKLFSNVQVLSDNPNSLKWIVQYDPTQEILPDGTKTFGKIIYMEDENMNRAAFDFKNVRVNFNNFSYYTFSTYTGEENSENCFNNNLCFGKLNVFFGSCNNNVIYGNCNCFTRPVNNLVGKLEGMRISNIGLDDFSQKQIIQYNNKKYLDYLDNETLTHQFYELADYSSISQ